MSHRKTKPELAGIEADVIVCGGGIAGLTAAVSASRAGAHVCLIERYGFLGGAISAGLVAGLQIGPPVRDQQVIRGIYDEIIERLLFYEPGVAYEPGLSGYTLRPFPSELMKLVGYDLCEEAGVRLLLHSSICGVDRDGAMVDAVWIAAKEGLRHAQAPIYVDATGDGDVAAFAGAPYEIGRRSDGLPQAITLIFRLGNIHVDEEQLRAVDANLLSTRFREETGITSSRGRIRLPKPGEHEITLNATHVAGLAGIDSDELTQAEVTAHQQAKAVRAFYRQNVPGCEKCSIAVTGTQVGVRETRRIMGDYVLTREDVLYGRKFDDAIGCSTAWVDIHNPAGEGVLHEFVVKDDWFEIPYRSLLVRDLDNLFVTGRCISSTHEGISAVRVIPTCAVTGQGAGVAAALAAKHGTTSRTLAWPLLREELVSQGVYLRQRDNLPAS